jgi:hypothetical protein
LGIDGSCEVKKLPGGLRGMKWIGRIWWELEDSMNSVRVFKGF